MDSPIKVVVVDDNACMVWGLKHLIDSEKPGMVIADTVSRATDVVRSVRLHQPDVVLLEIDVEENSALELISLVNEGCGAKIIIFTGNRDEALHERAILAGAHGLVLKSEPVNTVLRAIRAVHAGELWLKRDVTAKIVAMMTAAYHQSATPHCNSLFTPSENRVIAAAVKYRGAPNKVIADVLHMSANTFRNHLSTIYGKLGIHRRLDLVLYGLRHGAGEQADLATSRDAIGALRNMPVANDVPLPIPELCGSRAPADEARVVPKELRDGPRSAAGAAVALRGGEVERLPDSAIGGVGTILGTRPPAAASGATHSPVRIIRAALRRVDVPGITRR